VSVPVQPRFSVRRTTICEEEALSAQTARACPNEPHRSTWGRPGLNQWPSTISITKMRKPFVEAKS
jgi:hypothetical protein